MRSTFLGIRLASLVLAAFWCLIFFGTHYPKMHLPGFQWADKVYHMLAYAGLSFLLAWALPKSLVKPSRHIWIALVIALTYGAFDELSQSLVRGRTTELLDFAADSVGALVGLAGYLLVRKFVVQRISFPSGKPVLPAN